MQQSYFMKIYRKRWTYRLLGYGFATIIILALIGIGLTQYDNAKKHPTVVKTFHDYNTAVKNDSYVQIAAADLYDLNLVMSEQTYRLGIPMEKSTTGLIVATELDKKLLLISLPKKVYENMANQKSGPYIITGRFTGLKDKDAPVVRDALIKAGIPAGQIDSVLCINYLEYKTPLDVTGVYFFPAGLLAIVLLFYFFSVKRKNTKALQRLKNFSNGNLETACAKIDEEIQLPDVYQNPPVTVTQNYIIVENQSIVLAMPLAELMWIYKKTIQYRAYGVIPTGKGNKMVMVFSDGGVYEIDIRKKNSDPIIQYIAEHCPASYAGFSQELAELFKKNPNEFITMWRNKTKNAGEETD